jgi:hypothetical protein
LDTALVEVAAEILGRGDLGEASEILDGAVHTQHKIRNVGAGQIKMGRVQEIERLEA